MMALKTTLKCDIPDEIAVFVTFVSQIWNADLFKGILLQAGFLREIYINKWLHCPFVFKNFNLKLLVFLSRLLPRLLLVGHCRPSLLIIHSVKQTPTQRYVKRGGK